MTAKLSAEELEKLEALAKAATPGPWAWESVNEKGNDWCVGVIVDANDQPVSGRVVGDEDGAVDVFVCSGDGLHNAAHIAAANPAVVLRLTAQVREAEARWKDITKCLQAAVAADNLDWAADIANEMERAR